MRTTLDDGTFVDTAPGDVYDIPPGHDSWVVGDEAVVSFEYSGAAGSFATPAAVDRVHFRGHEAATTGDGSLATFDGAARAVRCAASVRRALEPLGIAIRAGVHTGEIEYDGGEVRGVAVHAAARVMSFAGPARSSSLRRRTTCSPDPGSTSRIAGGTSSRAWAARASCTRFPTSVARPSS